MMNTTTVLEPTHILTPYEVNDPRLTPETAEFRSEFDEYQGKWVTEVLKAPKTILADQPLIDSLPGSQDAADENGSAGWRDGWTIHLPGYDYEIVGWVKNNTLDWVLERIDKENNE